MNKNSVLSFLGLFAALALVAQKPEEEFALYLSQYPEANAVVIDKYEILDIRRVADTLQVRSENYEETIYLGDKPSVYAKDRVFSSGFSKTSDLQAYTLLPDKRKYNELKVTEFKETFDRDAHVFFDDDREITFHYPSLIKGSKSVLKYKLDYKDPRIIGINYFQSYKPIDKISYSVIFDPSVEVEADIFNDPNGWITKQETVRADGRKMITCTARKVPKAEFGAQSPSFQSLAPTVYFRIVSYKKADGSRQPVLSDLDHLYTWYETFVDGLGNPGESIVNQVNSIVQPADSELDKVRKIYYWVQQNIKYIAFEDGMRGFVPHPGQYVLEKRYGDCKDMSSILVDMLTAAGIEAHHTWIGTRDIPYSYSDTPAPIVDNHMIATCKINGKWYFLDATGSYTPVFLPTSMIQGKECFISLKDTYELVKVPVIGKEQNVLKDSVHITLDQGAVKGSGEVVLDGYVKVFGNYSLIKNSKKDVDNYLNRVLVKGSNKFQTGKYTLENLNDLESPTRINYDFTVPDYYQEVSGQIFLNMILDRSLVDGIIEKRKVPIENDYLYTNVNVSVLDLPAGLKVKHLPDNESHVGDHFGFDITYEQKGDKLIATKKYFVNYLQLDPADFENWNAAIKKYSAACRNAVVLTKNND